MTRCINLRDYRMVARIKSARRKYHPPEKAQIAYLKKTLPQFVKSSPFFLCFLDEAFDRLAWIVLTRNVRIRYSMLFYIAAAFRCASLN